MGREVGGKRWGIGRKERLSASWI